MERSIPDLVALRVDHGYHGYVFVIGTFNHMRSSLFAIAIFSIVPFSLIAQEQQVLPKGIAPHEIPLIPEYRNSRGPDARGITTPPDVPVRTMAEWEEVQSLVIAWQGYESILKQIVRHAKEECEVIIVCEDQSEVMEVLASDLAGGPMNLDNITLLEAPSNSVWIRDYGPEVIYKNEVDTLMLLDWIYNRPRPQDDAVSDVLAEHLNLPIYSTTSAPYDLVHTGGNFMADGFGTAFSSALVLDENGPSGDFNQTVKDQAQVEELMNQFMGILPGRYIIMETLPFDEIHHIDMHMKLIDEETLLVGQFPAGVSDGPQLESNLDAINSTYNSVFGSPYEYVRIPMPPSTSGNYAPNASYRTYANNIFINGTVLVPTYRDEFDTTGLRILRETLPGYNVIGIDCDDQGANIISASGAIHCITKTIGVEDPLLIRHQRLRDTYETIQPYEVNAYIRHRSGIASARVHWTIDTAQGFALLEMQSQGDDMWMAAIPAQSVGSEIFYYIEGEAVNGKVQVRPIVAPEGWWKFEVLDINASLADVAGPAIMEIFPNPTSSVMMATVSGTGDERVRVSLNDALGREVMFIHEGRMPADGRVFADLSYLSEGAYLLIVQNENGRHVSKVI
ncbi:MAG: agmatine deiminase family protein, partial [Bacteroidota bacterium]|nr:agmatine deiminase family protein [Bacteroidota bacterium]